MIPETSKFKYRESYSHENTDFPNKMMLEITLCFIGILSK